MKIKLDAKMLEFLNGMIRYSREFQVAMTLVNPPLRIYQASDGPGARQLVALQKWLEEKVFERVTNERGVEEFKFVEKEVGLKKVYVDRLLEMLAHYKNLGLTGLMAEPYWRLLDALEGRQFEVDDPSEDEKEA